MKITEFFKEAFYINLDDRVDRQEHMTKELSKHNLQDYVKRYSAIKAVEKNPENCMKASGTSHRNLIQYAKDNNLDNILILEDDIFFKEGGIEIIEKSLDSLLKYDWDVFYFSANIFDNPLNLKDENLLIINGCYCIHAYGVNKQAYDRLLKYDPMKDNPFDAYIQENPFKRYAAYPLAISQYDSVSDNIGGFIGYDKIFVDCYSRPVQKC
jgi:GR25 family glycosyltransferase involved in LPS biosynthesis